MNALVTFRANATGALSPTPEKRFEAAQQVAANLLAKAAHSQTKAGLVTKAGTEDAEGRVVEQTLDKDAFLRLLVLQMQNQDPLEPMDNADMLAQLAQFSSLEQMNNLNDSFQTLSSNFEGLSSSFGQLSFISANALLGRTIAGTDIDGVAHEGVVEHVILDAGTVFLSVDGARIPMDNIERVQ
ncbi:unnamed protein product [marine sediment metagenome]|uniref:FlgD Tudor-like domain-containing protein n=1 Tax=marine sediment metagenome TaxID=412755 RepID=X0S3I7_9ZZZZ